MSSEQFPPNVPPSPQMPPQLQPKLVEKGKGGGHGCLIGCLVAVLLMIVVVIGMGFMVKLSFDKILDAYTDEKPMELPTVEIGQEELDLLQERVEAFMDAVGNDEPAEELRLSQDDLNALIMNDPRFEAAQGHVFITVEDDVIGGMVSLPLDELPLPFMEGRYLNAEATFRVFLEAGRLHAYFDSMKVKENDVPAEYMDVMSNENLLKEFNRGDPEFRKVMGKLEDVRIEDGLLIIVPKNLVDESEAISE